MKYKYPDIKLVSYDCKNEKSFMESERQKWEDIYSRRKKQQVHLHCVDEIVDFKQNILLEKPPTLREIRQ